MAQSLRRPLSRVVGLTSVSQTPFRRPFSNYKPLLINAQTMARLPRGQPQKAAERSIKIAQKQAESKALNKPNDIGLLPQTFIMPSGPRAPSLFAHPLRFLKLQYERMRFRMRDVASRAVLKVSSPRNKGVMRWSLKLNRKVIKPAAVALHRQMYLNFAEGDLPALRQITTDGIYDSFARRVATRRKGEKMEWELVGYNKRARIVSDRGAKLPLDGWGVRQAVVRISSRQKLTRYLPTKGGKLVMVPGSGQEREVLEYVVLQQNIEEWIPGEWRVWGTVQESTLEEVEQWKRTELE